MNLGDVVLPAACWRRGARGWLAGDLPAEVDYELVEGLCCWLRWNAATECNLMLPLAEFPMHCILLLNTMNSATQYNVMPPPNATLCATRLVAG
jgi:hypothetical protein